MALLRHFSRPQWLALILLGAVATVCAEAALKPTLDSFSPEQIEQGIQVQHTPWHIDDINDQLMIQ